MTHRYIPNNVLLKKNQDFIISCGILHNQNGYYLVLLLPNFTMLKFCNGKYDYAVVQKKGIPYLSIYLSIYLCPVCSAIYLSILVFSAIYLSIYRSMCVCVCVCVRFHFCLYSLITHYTFFVIKNNIFSTRNDEILVFWG